MFINLKHGERYVGDSSYSGVHNNIFPLQVSIFCVDAGEYHGQIPQRCQTPLYVRCCLYSKQASSGIIIKCLQ